jgi:hypothetical protein
MSHSFNKVKNQYAARSVQWPSPFDSHLRNSISALNHPSLTLLVGHGTNSTGTPFPRTPFHIHDCLGQRIFVRPHVTTGTFGAMNDWVFNRIPADIVSGSMTNIEVREDW